MRSLQPHFVCHARHVAFLASDVMQKILVLKAFTRFAQRQIKWNAADRTRCPHWIESDFTGHTPHIFGRNFACQASQCERFYRTLQYRQVARPLKISERIECGNTELAQRTLIGLHHLQQDCIGQIRKVFRMLPQTRNAQRHAGKLSKQRRIEFAALNQRQHRLRGCCDQTNVEFFELAKELSQALLFIFIQCFELVDKQHAIARVGQRRKWVLREPTVLSRLKPRSIALMHHARNQLESTACFAG